VLIVATAYINWSALWKIVLAALVGGAGVVIVFGFLLVGVKIANNAKSGGREWAGYALAGVCGLFCAMINKPKSKPAPKKTAAALIAPPARSSL
jgi:hypothetical protein